MTRFLIEVTEPADKFNISEARKLARQQALERIPLHIVEEEVYQEPRATDVEGPEPPKTLRTWWDFHS